MIGKAEKQQRVPLAVNTQQVSAQVHVPAGRRTRASLAALEPAADINVRVEDKLALKKKALSSKVPLTKRVMPSTSTASASTSTSHSNALKPTRSQTLAKTRDNGHVEPILDDHAAKRRRTSTPPPLKEENVDELDEANYDQDGQEIILSSGGRGVSMKSPKRKTKRAKDEGWTDLDLEDEGDPTMVSEYVVDAFNYMLEIEVGRGFHDRSPRRMPLTNDCFSFGSNRDGPCPLQRIWKTKRKFNGKCAKS